MEQSIKTINATEETATKKCPLPWWKRIGFLGFMFFFLKGMGWIAVFAISYIWGPEALGNLKAFFTNIF